MGRGKTGNFRKAAAILLGCALLTGCGSTGEVDDYATNIGYEARGGNGTTQVVQSESGSSATTQTAGIPKEEIKVGVLHLSDPAEGSGYTYTHDLGIQGMQQNLGLSDDQIVRKINVNDGDAKATRQAIQECIDDGCNIIFTTSWGYMETTAEMAEEYPDVYFSHGTGYMSNGKNFNNYFGRIYQARYLSGIVAGMNTSSNKIGYVAAMDSSNSEVTGGIDAFALGIYSVNPDAKVYVRVTNSWYDPEGTGYRARTRFSKFFNLPELMNLFKEVADIKTADQLNLPTPEVEYHNIVAQPTEHQQEMVKALSERASLVHSGTVDPSQDNMLKITSDGRKLGLDQRIVNQMLPDEPGTKVNQCVDNIMQIWRDGKADKLTQLVFCDISTPQAKAPASKAAKTLDNPLLHALEGAVPLPEQEPVFTVYDDIRQKLIAQGMPADQIAFIHEANTEVRKKELFSKVRTGQVRVLLGSTAKMGAGTNVQDRLVALHDLDCPWRPGDLAQRKGRIERQGNQNPLVHVYRYVTEGTFDAYLWQTVENKQKFISQIMTSKSPVRSCDDVDETALSFAEIKALCAGDPRIKERMDLDVEVSRLKLMKADHQSKQYRLEDQLLKYFPEEIEKHKGFIKGFESDLEVLAAHPHPEDGFAGMEIRGDLLTDKENAGAALLDACKEVKTSDPVQIGSYRGYAISVEFSAWKQEYTLLLKGQMTHRATLGTDPRGNLTRIDNALAQMPQRLEAAKAQLDNLYQQQAAAKEEVGKPFLYEEELRSKNARLVELDTLLNIDGKGQAHTESVVAKSTRPSVLDNLKRPVQPRSTDKKPKQHEEVR